VLIQFVITRDSGDSVRVRICVRGTVLTLCSWDEVYNARLRMTVALICGDMLLLVVVALLGCSAECCGFGDSIKQSVSSRETGGPLSEFGCRPDVNRP